MTIEREENKIRPSSHFTQNRLIEEFIKSLQLNKKKLEEISGVCVVETILKEETTKSQRKRQS